MNWQEYLMGFARHAASKSKDTTKVGCVIVRDDNTVCVTGYNGPPMGVHDTPERLERPLKYQVTSHAEANAIAFAAANGVRITGSRMYVTHAPCLNCAKLIIQSGISYVCVGDGKVSGDHWGAEQDLARVLFDEAGVVYDRIR